MIYVLSTAAILLVFYTCIHPRFSRRDVHNIMVVDFWASVLIVVAAIIIRMISGDSHAIIGGREFHWILITVAAIILIEIPLFILYLRVKGISFAEYANQLMTDDSDPEQ